MKVTQAAEILNTITQEMLGDSVVVNEDLSNIVDVGRAFENLENGYDTEVNEKAPCFHRVSASLYALPVPCFQTPRS